MNNNNRTSLVGVIVQAGAVGIALVAVYFMYNLATNHISGNTEVLIELKGAIENSTQVGREQVRVLGDLERAIQINFSK